MSDRPRKRPRDPAQLASGGQWLVVTDFLAKAKEQLHKVLDEARDTPVL